MSSKQSYILGIDIGNTNIALALFEKNQDLEILYQWRVATQNNSTSDELGITLVNLIKFTKIEITRIENAIISSVVPALNFVMREALEKYFQIKVSNIINTSCKLKLPLKFDYPNPEEIGADRIVNACIAGKIYGGDLIIVDLGTATTFCVIHDGTTFKGGCIAPGLKIAIESLSTKTAQLPLVEFKKPASVVGKSTVEAIQSGFFYGWVGIISEIISQIRKVHPDHNYRVIATGGLSEYVHKECSYLFDEVDLELTLKGLKYISNLQTLPSVLK